MIQIREMTPEDRLIAGSWWEKKNGFELPDAFGGLGLIGLIDDKPVFAGHILISHDHKVGFVAFITANPDSDNNDRKTVFPVLMEGFEKVAKDLGVKLLFTTTNVASLGARIEESGFQRCDVDVVHYLKRV